MVFLNRDNWKREEKKETTPSSLYHILPRRCLSYKPSYKSSDAAD